MLTAPTAAPPKSTNPIQRLVSFLLEPRSQNRDERFRERTIRITITIVAIFSLLALLITTLVFHDEWTLSSLQTLESIIIVLCLASAFAIAKQRITMAGVFLVLNFIVAAMFIIPQHAIDNATVLSVPIYMIAVLTAALVLPRSTIIPLGIISPFLMTLMLEVADPGNPYNGKLLASSIFIFLVEALFLRQLRVEFDNRLAAMRESIAEAEKARHEADEANQAKSQFLANMSHELRTPLNAIIGYTEIMLNGMAGTFTDKQTQLQGFIQINAKRLLALINDILDLAKIESGTIEVLATLAAPRKVIGDAIDGMQSLVQNKNIYLKATFDDTMPEMILVDVQKIQQIVTNLVSNAVKFTNEGGVEVKVGSTQPNTWQIKVIDSGRGMPPDAANYIFESFRQVDSSDSREHKGTGLGLAITKRLIDKLGGTVELHSEIGKGSTFTVTLPRLGQEVARNAEKQAEPVAS